MPHISREFVFFSIDDAARRNGGRGIHQTFSSMVKGVFDQARAQNDSQVVLDIYHLDATAAEDELNAIVSNVEPDSVVEPTNLVPVVTRSIPTDMPDNRTLSSFMLSLIDPVRNMRLESSMSDQTLYWNHGANHANTWIMLIKPYDMTLSSDADHPSHVVRFDTNSSAPAPTAFRLVRDGPRRFYVSANRRQVDRYAMLMYQMVESMQPSNDDDDNNERIYPLLERLYDLELRSPALPNTIVMYREPYMRDQATASQLANFIDFQSSRADSRSKSLRTVFVALLAFDTLIHLYRDFGLVFDDLDPAVDMHIYRNMSTGSGNMMRWRVLPEFEDDSTAQPFVGFGDQIAREYAAMFPREYARRIRVVVTATRGDQAQRWPNSYSMVGVVTDDAYAKYHRASDCHFVTSLQTMFEQLPNFDYHIHFMDEMSDYLQMLRTEADAVVANGPESNVGRLGALQPSSVARQIAHIFNRTMTEYKRHEDGRA